MFESGFYLPTARRSRYNDTAHKISVRVKTTLTEGFMISDERQRILAKNLVTYSCEVQPGENVLIEASGDRKSVV